MLNRFQIVILAGFGILLTAIVLIVVTQQREKEFATYQFESQKILLANTSKILAQHIFRQRQNLQWFVSQNHQLLAHLRFYPQDPKAFSKLQNRMRQTFPGYFNFTIIDENGSPIWMDIETKVGTVCQNEIDHFSKEAVLSGIKAKNSVLIHPNLHQYHYDLMTLLVVRPNVNNIFFVSFYPDGLAKILKSQQKPGHQLILVKKGDTALIEITAEGARDKIHRDIRLTKKEMLGLKTFKDVKGTDWRVVDLQDQSYLDSYRQQLWQKASTIALIAFIIGLFLIVALIRLLSAKR